jgi:formylglycine-generating enzyme required for sulfatase activity
MEQVSWDEAQRGNTASSYAAYLEKFPSGRFAAQAKAFKLAAEDRVASAKRAEEELVKAGLVKKVEQERLAAEVRKAEELRIQTERAKRAEDDRLAALAKKASEQRTASFKPDMVVIPAGSFMMGSKSAFLFGADKNSEEKPQHLVKVPSFLMGKTEVTQGEWKSVMGSNPSGFNECGDTCPVDTVSWIDAQEFIQKLNQLTGQSYRLPSEAEWEYAARAGTTTEWSFGNDESKVGNYAWYLKNSVGETQVISQKLPNAFGLHDMHGNVAEWVEDCWHKNYLNAPMDGSAWTTGCERDHRVFRGGSWGDNSTSLRSAYRDKFNADRRNGLLGFRLAVNWSDQFLDASTPTQRVSAELAKNADKGSLATIKDCFSCPEMVYLSGGHFEMGSNLQPNEMPVHNVAITSFYVGKTEITQAQWQDVMSDNPSRFRGVGSNWPVESISWDDAQLYVQLLSKRTGKSYRLLSEAEWEFAAKGKDLGRWNFGDNDQKLFEFAWVGSNSKGTTQAVAQKKPNEFGLYDMYGNVEEWVADCYHDSYIGAPENSSPWLKDCKGGYKVRRGGSWAMDPAEARSSSRDFGTPGLTRHYLGLRVARDP